MKNTTASSSLGTVIMASIGLILGTLGVAHGTIGKFSWFLIVVSTLIIFISMDTLKRSVSKIYSDLSKNKLQEKTTMLLLVIWIAVIVGVFLIRLNL